MAEAKSRWMQMTDSAAQATKTVVERTQELAQRLDSGVRREALDDVRKAREVIRKADHGLTQLFDRIEHWAQTPPRPKSAEGQRGTSQAGEAKKSTSKPQGASTQAS